MEKYDTLYVSLSTMIFIFFCQMNCQIDDLLKSLGFKLDYYWKKSGVLKKHEIEDPRLKNGLILKEKT